MLARMLFRAAEPAAAPLADVQRVVREMKADPANAGKYLITRRSDGQTFSNVASGDVVDDVLLRAAEGVVAEDFAQDREMGRHGVTALFWGDCPLLGAGL